MSARRCQTWDGSGQELQMCLRCRVDRPKGPWIPCSKRVAHGADKRMVSWYKRESPEVFGEIPLRKRTYTVYSGPKAWFWGGGWGSQLANTNRANLVDWKTGARSLACGAHARCDLGVSSGEYGAHLQYCEIGQRKRTVEEIAY